MHHFHESLVCQICPGYHRLRIAADDADRILYRINEVLGFNRGTPVHGKRADRPTLFHQIVSCTYMSGSCSRFQSEEHRLRKSEEALERAFDKLAEKIKELIALGKDGEAKQIRQKAYNLFRGYYPHAARIIQCCGEEK